MAGISQEPDPFWSRYSKVYDGVYQLMSYRKLLWDTYQALDLQPDMRVLDAGCGTGNFEHFIAQKNPPQMRVEALDFSTGMLAAARAKCEGLDFVDFSFGDLNQPLPYPDATFDRIVSVNVLYTLEDWRDTMSEFIRITKPGGRIVVTSSRPEYRASAMVADHFKRVRNIWGFSRQVTTVFQTVRMLSTTAVGSAILNTFVIDRREKQGRYHSVGHEELRGYLENGVSDHVHGYAIWPVLADQNVMATVTKAASAQV
jgi:ubiquinone/menaquinone biosynthesis C-methylase UbiE